MTGSQPLLWACIGVLFVVESFVFVSGCPAQGLPSGKVSVLHVTRPEGQRSFHVYVPTNYNASQPTILHLSFHGLDDNCDDMMANSGFKALADTQNFIFVAPCGSIGFMGIAWNSGTCCGFRADSKTDDFAFTSYIVETIQSKLCVDTTRIYASGFSNGAMMASVIGCKLSSTFRAVASVSGIVELRPGNGGGLDACDQVYLQGTNKVSEINIHGDYDIVVPWPGDPVLGFPPVPEDFERWAKRNNCTGTPVQTFNHGNFSNQVYQTCKGGSQVELVKHQYGGHEWPVGQPFDAPSYIMSFFARVSP